jgi:hypothetical protein
MSFDLSALVEVGEGEGQASTELLTRKEASAFLATLGVSLKPSTLARLWSTGGNGPPCVHHRNRPRYPREVLRAWAAQQTTQLRTSAREPRSSSQAREEAHRGL